MIKPKGSSEDAVIYFDKPNECIGICYRSKKVIFTGMTIYSEPVKSRNEESIKLFSKEDFHFFFDDEIPNLKMYAIPALLILGYDSCGGYFAAIDGDISFDESFPLYYISFKRIVYRIEGDRKLLPTGKLNWKEHLVKADDIKIYQGLSDLISN